MNKTQKEIAERNRELAGLTKDYPVVKQIVNHYSAANILQVYGQETGRHLINKARELYRGNGLAETLKAMDLPRIVKALNLIMRPINLKKQIDIPAMTLANLYLLLADAKREGKPPFSDRPLVTETELPISYVGIVWHLWKRNMGQHQIASHTGYDLIRIRTLYRGLEELLRLQNPSTVASKRKLDSSRVPTGAKPFIDYLESTAGIVKIGGRIFYVADKQELLDKFRPELEKEASIAAESQDTIDLATVRAATRHAEIVAEQQDIAEAPPDALAQFGTPPPPYSGVLADQAPVEDLGPVMQAVEDAADDFFADEDEPSTESQSTEELPILPVTEEKPPPAKPIPVSAKHHRLANFLAGGKAVANE